MVRSSVSKPRLRCSWHREKLLSLLPPMSWQQRIWIKQSKSGQFMQVWDLRAQLRIDSLVPSKAEYLSLAVLPSSLHSHSSTRQQLLKISRVLSLCRAWQAKCIEAINSRSCMKPLWVIQQVSLTQKGIAYCRLGKQKKMGHWLPLLICLLLAQSIQGYLCQRNLRSISHRTSS